MQRRLGVDDHLLAAGQLDDEVGPQQAVSVGDRGLLDEVAVRRHPRQLDDASELQLAPAPARLRLAQRRDERAGLGAQRSWPLASARSCSSSAPRACWRSRSSALSCASMRASASWIGSC